MEVSCEVALVRKTRRQGYFGQGQLCLSQHVLDVFQPSPQYITVRGYPHGLVEGARKMVCGKPGHGSQGSKADSLAKVRFDVVANAARESRRQSAAAGCWRLGYRQVAQGTDSQAGGENRFRPATYHPRSAQLRRKQYAPRPPVNTSPHQPNTNGLPGINS